MKSELRNAEVVEIARKRPSARANALAERLEQGARALLDFAATLTEEEWQTRVPHDGRKIGVVVHHVGNMYPLEVALTQKIAAGEPIVGVTPADVAVINAEHARERDAVTKAEALEFVRRNSEAAAEAVRELSDEELETATPNSYYDGAPMTCQFWIEDHELRHSFHHLDVIRRVVKR
jgi:hypothetical protein